MLSGGGPITSRQHKWIFSLVGFGLGLRLVELALSLSGNEGQRSFAIYSIFEMEEMMSPVYSFIVFLICVVLLRRVSFTRMAFSSVLLLVLAFFFDYWFADSQSVIERWAETAPEVLIEHNPILLAGSTYDVITLLLANVLVVWTVFASIRLFFASSVEQENLG